MMNSTGSSRKISRRGVGTGCKERRGMPEHFRHTRGKAGRGVQQLLAAGHEAVHFPGGLKAAAVIDFSPPSLPSAPCSELLTL